MDFERDAKRSSLLDLRKVSDESLGCDERPVVRLQEAKIQTFFTHFATNWTKGNKIKKKKRMKEREPTTKVLTWLEDP